MVWPSFVAGRTRSRMAAARRRRRRGGEEAVVVISDGEEEEEVHVKEEVVEEEDNVVVGGRGGEEELEEEEEQYTEDDRPAPTTTTTTSDEEEEEEDEPPPLKPVLGKQRYGRLEDAVFSKSYLPDKEPAQKRSKSNLAGQKGSKSHLPGRGIGAGGRRRKVESVKVIDISDDSSGVGDEDGSALYYGGGGRKRKVSGKRRRSSGFGRFEAPILWEKKKRWKPSVFVKTRSKKERRLDVDSGSSSSTSRSRWLGHGGAAKKCEVKEEELSRGSTHEQEPGIAKRAGFGVKLVSSKDSGDGGLPQANQEVADESSSSSFGEVNADKLVDVAGNESSSSLSSFGEPATGPAPVDGDTKEAKDTKDVSSDSTFNERGDDNSIGGDVNSKLGGGQTLDKGVFIGNSGESKPGEREHLSASRRNDPVFDLLVNTIWDKGKMLQEERGTRPVVEEVPTQDNLSLPRKFIHSDDWVPKTNEKTELEMAIEKIWGEYEFARASLHLGSFDTMNDRREGGEREHIADHSMRCLEGDHEFVLDDQVGIMCNICGFIKEEIRYIFPSMYSKTWGQSGKTRYPGEGDYSVLDGLYYPDTNNGKSSGPSGIPPGTVWDMIPKIRLTLFPHQREGLEFMWKNLAGSIHLEDLKKSSIPNGGEEGGCVISHAPGTGKTRLTIVFLQSFMEVFPTCKPMIIAPQAMLLVWEGEIKKWKVDIPFHNLNVKGLSGNEDAAAVKLVNKSGQTSINLVRLVKLHSWHKRKSILLISYDLFQKLTTGTKEPKDSPSKRKKKRQEKEGAEIAKILLEKPTLLVLDEGHRPRNNRSEIWKSFIKVKAKSRIILSGTPFQNNLKELHSTLCLVRPDFSGTQKFQTVLSKNRERDGWATLTKNFLQAPDEKLREVQSLFSSFVHVYEGGILKSLPGKRDCWVVLEPCSYQKVLLEKIQEIPAESCLGRNCSVSWISIHPSLALKSKLSGSESRVVDRPRLEKIRNDPSEGVKTKFLVELVRLSCIDNEKVLIFSEHIEPLELVKEQLMLHFNWMEEKEVLEINGQTKNLRTRELRMESFNDASSEARVLLATTRTCCEGINLVGASRVVLLDVVWNPSVEKQAISRAFRMGQKKVVYIYHLITAGAQDKDKFYRQATKQRVSKLVFSSKAMHEGEQSDVLGEIEDKILEAMIRHEKLKDMFGKVHYNQPNSLDLTDHLEVFKSAR